MSFPNLSYSGAAQTPVGPWSMTGTELRTLCPYGGRLFAGNGQWEAPAGDAYAAQILVQETPPSGPWTVEAQLPSAIFAVTSMAAVPFPHTAGSPWKLATVTSNSPRACIQSQS
jgi:hypothetical protein